MIRVPLDAFRPLASLLIALALCACGEDSDGADPADGAVTSADTAAHIDKGDIAATDGGCTADEQCAPGDNVCTPNRCVAGACAPVPLDAGPCDDGDVCTANDTCAGGVCVAGPNACACKKNNDCLSRDDGDLCNGVPRCDTSVVPHVCVPDPMTVIACDSADDTACQRNRCQPATGECKMAAAPDQTPCSDGDPCSPEDRCMAGKCVGSKASACACKVDADCAAADDGDVCNGKLYCDTAVFPFACKTNPASIVSCSAAKDTACSKNTCDPKTGICDPASVADGTPCDDTDPMTVGDTCNQGSCKPGKSIKFCDGTSDCAAFEDGNWCNGVTFCNKVTSKCEVNPASVVVCPTVNDTACSKNQCLPGTGQCVPTPVADKAACDDGDDCTKGDHCVGGTCAPGTNTCLCKKNADCVAKDDGNLCNGVLFCNVQSGTCEANAASVVTCPTVDDNACSKNICAPKTGKCAMVAQAKGIACSDNDACTVGDTCADGKCAPGQNTCLCKTDGDCAAKEDGDLCNGVLFCNKQTGDCELNKATTITCPTVDDTTCRKNTCQAKTGKCLLIPVANGSACDDGSACTKADACLAGACVGVQTCQCESHADCAALEDGDLCNGVLYCDKSGPAPKCLVNAKTVVTCVALDGQPCVVNTCNPATGICQPKAKAKGEPCEDGDKCTTKDTCAAGLCKGGPALDCTDNKPCTDDGCDAKSGCTFDPKTCDDGNTCTLDSCEAKTGKCSSSAKPLEGNVCNADNNGCTVNDVCKAGSCLTGLKAICNLPVKDCQQAACQTTGNTGYKCVVLTSPDGAACLGDDGCIAGGTCSKGTCQPGKDEKFYEKAIAASALAAQDKAVVVSTDVVGVAAMPDGGVLTASHAVKPLPGGAKQTWWWIGRLSAWGTPLWTHLAGTPAGKPSTTSAHRALALVVGADGGAVVAGRIADGGDKIGVLVLDDKGKAKWMKAWPQGKEVRTVRAVDRLLDGSIAVISRADYKDAKGKAASVPTVLRLSKGGAVTWQADLAPLDGAGQHDPVAALHWPTGGGFVLGNNAQAIASDSHGKLWRVTDEGKVAWQRSWSTWLGTRAAAFVAISDTKGADTGFAIAGAKLVGKAPQGWLLRVDKAGQPMWQRAISKAWQLTGIAHLGGGLLTMAGQRQPLPNIQQAWLAGTDIAGHLTWQHTYAASDQAGLKAITAAGMGAVALGHAKTGAGHHLLAISTDAWGHVDCKGAGLCAKKSAPICDDGKPCTIDLCHPTKGCVHYDADGQDCDPEDGCTLQAACKAGACVKGANGRYFETGVASAGLKTVHGVVATHNDGIGLVGSDGGQPRYVRLSATGEQLMAATATLPTGLAMDWLGGAVGLADGSVVVTGHKGKEFGQGETSKAASVARIAADGKLLWAQITCDYWSGPAVCTAEDLVLAGGGLHVLTVTVHRGMSGAWQASGIITVQRRDVTDGKLVGNALKMQHKGLLETGRPYRVGAVLRAKGGLLLGGDYNLVYQGAPPTGVFAHAVSLSAGQTIWVGLHKPWMRFGGVVDTPDGGALIAGNSLAANGTQQVRMVRFDGKGKQVWASSSKGDDFQVTSLVAAGPHHLLSGRQGGAQVRLGLRLIDQLGKGVWARTYGPATGLIGGITGPAVAPLKNGHVTGAAVTTVAGTSVLVVRTDPWGWPDCAKSGKCMAKTASDCDDKNPCTADLCVGGSGCSYPALADGLACGVGKTCKQGSCK